MIDPNHSYCSQPFLSAIDQVITASDRTTIVDMHNLERARVRGTNMEKMVLCYFLVTSAIGHVLVLER